MMTFEVFIMAYSTRFPIGKLHVAEHCHLFIDNYGRRQAGSTAAIEFLKKQPSLQLRRIDTPAHMQRKLY